MPAVGGLNETLMVVNPRVGYVTRLMVQGTMWRHKSFTARTSIRHECFVNYRDEIQTLKEWDALQNRIHLGYSSWHAGLPG